MTSLQQWPLKSLALIQTSNVDKKSKTDEEEVFLCNYTDVYYNDIITSDLDFMTATASHDQIRRFSLRSGDVIITKDSETADDIAVPALVTHDLPGVVCGYHLSLLRPDRSVVEARYLFWALSSDHVRQQFEVGATGVTRFGLRSDVIGWSKIPIHPIVTQALIADFLDQETARIDALADKKQRLTELFMERPQGVAEREFDHLLSISELVPVKYLVREIDFRLGQAEIPMLLSVSIHHGVIPRAEITDKLPRAEDMAKYKVVKPDDIAVNRMRAFQGGVGVAKQQGIVSPDYTVLRPRPSFDSSYAHHLFRSRWFVGEMTRRLRGIGSSDQGNVRTPRISFRDLGAIKVPLPSLDVQQTLAGRLDEIVLLTATLVSRLEKQQMLLSEYRQALITAAVIGELDVADFNTDEQLEAVVP